MIIFQQHDLYKDIQYRNQLSPHVFWIANQAYRKVCLSKRSQCIIVSGESGSGSNIVEYLSFFFLCVCIFYEGKTESTKLMVSHVIYCSGIMPDRELQNRIIEVSIKMK